MGIDEVKKLVDEQIKDCKNLKKRKELTEEGEGHYLIAKAVAETIGTKKGRGCLLMIELIAQELSKNNADWIKEYKTRYY